MKGEPELTQEEADFLLGGVLRLVDRMAAEWRQDEQRGEAAACIPDT